MEATGEDLDPQDSISPVGEPPSKPIRQSCPNHRSSDRTIEDLVRQLSDLVALVKAFPREISLSPPPGQFVIASLLQLIALGIAIAFGIYAVKSVRIANEANEYASQALQAAQLANQIAMFSFCASMRQSVSTSYRLHLMPVVAY